MTSTAERTQDTERTERPDALDPLDVVERVDMEAADAEDVGALDPYELPAVKRLLAGEWDVYEMYEVAAQDTERVRQKRYIAIRASTWKANPNARREDYVMNFAKTPRRALRDFACWPTAVEEPWLRDPSVLKRAVNGERVSPFDEKGVLSGDFEFRADFQPEEDAVYFVHIDYALRRDAAGLAMGHWCDKIHKCVIDLATSFRAEETENLDFGKIRAVVYELVNLGFDIQECTLDQWNSADTIAEFERHDLPAREITSAEQLASYDGLLELLIFGLIELYPQELLLKELRQLQWKGQKLDHPESGSKDIADSIAVVATQARAQGSNLVAFSSSHLPMSREQAVVGSSEQRDRLLGLRAGDDGRTGVV